MLDNNGLNLVNKHYDLHFAGEFLTLDAAGAIFWPRQNSLIIADLHLEKGSYFCARGNLIPRYDTLDTLRRIEKLTIRYQAKKIICLGDNLHDFLAIERMLPKDYDYLNKLNQIAEWVWIIGNHDPSATQHPLLKNFKFHSIYKINELTFQHDFDSTTPYQIIGHFHPKAIFRIRSHQITGKCFLVSENVIILPAFGSYTGGLDIESPVFEKILNRKALKYFFIKEEKIWLIPGTYLCKRE